MPLGFPAEAIASASRYAPRDDDIFVVSYPKCGTTWLQYIVLLLMRRKVLGQADALSDWFPHLEEVGADAVEAHAPPRLIKTHFGTAGLQISSSARYLYIARNPFDCAVSFYHHTKGFPRHYDFAEGEFSGFFESFLNGEVDFGDYFEHLIDWHGMVDADNVFFLTYEALKHDTAGMIRRIASFLGEEALSTIADAEGLNRVLAFSGIESMRKDQARWSSERPGWASRFVREGKVGGWRNCFSVGQAASLLAKFDRMLGDSELAGLWPDLVAEVREYAAVPRSS